MFSAPVDTVIAMIVYEHWSQQQNQLDRLNLDAGLGSFYLVVTCVCIFCDQGLHLNECKCEFTTWNL